MPKDPYQWTKERISYLIEKIELVKNDGDVISAGKIWSIKKLLALDYYIASTHAIFKKNFDYWYYVDTHCGSGVIGFEEDELLKLERFPGSPLIAALRNEHNPFSDYFFSDIDKDTISVLNSRLKKLKDHVGNRDYSPVVKSFSNTAQEIKSNESWGKIFLVFIDPTGYSDLQWNDVKKLLSIDKADVFITFMSYSIALNRPHARLGTEYEKTFDSVFGTSKWRGCSNQTELLELYLTQIKTLKEYVEVIPIFRAGENKLYDLIFASSNPKGAGSIMGYIKKIMNNVTTEIIESAMKVVTKKELDLDKWV